MTINLRKDRATQFYSVIIETAPKSPFLCMKNPCLSVELGFWVLIVRRIPDSLRCIPDSKAKDSRFHRKNFLDSGIRVLFHRAKNAIPYTEERRKNEIIDIHLGKLSTKRRLNTFQHSTKSIFNMRFRDGQLFAMRSFHF